MNGFCECKEDGWCPRYQRDMVGRIREICAGTNCDLGTAAAFREQWAQEVGTTSHLNPKKPPMPIMIKQSQAPGDAVVMTAAIHSLHKAHPGRYLTAVDTPYPEVFQHNPNVVIFCGMDWNTVEMHYPAIHQSNFRGIHFMESMCEHLGRALGVHVPLMTNRPHLYFSDNDTNTDDYWLICSGGKPDFTNKLWGREKYQNVVDLLHGRVKFIQVGGRVEDHPRLYNTEYNLVGKTSLRDLFEQVRHCRGVLCGVSLLMHVAAALDKPAIVIAGGREPVQWNSYPKQHYVHTVGATDCLSPQGEQGACWRSRVVPKGDNPTLDAHPCMYPQRYAPMCMNMIDPRHVANLVLCYNQQYERG